jgi:hypothetical protein
MYAREEGKLLFGKSQSFSLSVVTRVWLVSREYVLLFDGTSIYRRLAGIQPVFALPQSKVPYRTTHSEYPLDSIDLFWSWF